MHNSFTWGEAAALLRVSGRTVIHAARVLSEDSPAVPAGRLAVEQGRITVSDASRVMDEPAEVGGTLSVYRRVRLVSGLSPRLRGNRNPVELPPDRVRSIPAPAGEPPRHCQSV